MVSVSRQCDRKIEYLIYFLFMHFCLQKHKKVDTAPTENKMYMHKLKFLSHSFCICALAQSLCCSSPLYLSSIIIGCCDIQYTLFCSHFHTPRIYSISANSFCRSSVYNVSSFFSSKVDQILCKKNYNLIVHKGYLTHRMIKVPQY